MGDKGKKPGNTAKKNAARTPEKPRSRSSDEPPPQPQKPGGARPDGDGATRRDNLQRMLLAKRQEILDEIRGSLGQSLTEDQQRRLEAAMDVGDQALMDLQRELGISLLEMRNRKRQLIEDALVRVAEGLYGICAECGVEISEKRLAAVPFAKLCVECQTKQELLEKISKEEERD